MLRHRGAPYYHEIRYEDLFMNTEHTVRGMCEFLNVSFEERMLDFHLQKSPTRSYLNFPQNIAATQPIFTSSIGRYRTGLTAVEIAMVEERLASYLDALGYSNRRMASTRVTVPRPEDSSRGLTVLTAGQVYDAIEGDPLKVKEWTRDALRVHHEGRFLQPPKSYLVTSDLYDRIIALPAAVLGDEPVLGIKWIGSHSGNHARGLQRAHAVIVLNDPMRHLQCYVKRTAN